jgi:glycosyltransferase involved in cell wall biosynthesis
MAADRWHWHILTGEYPPTPGGVADYTSLVANGLAARGCKVDVWTVPAVVLGDQPLTLDDRPSAIGHPSSVEVHRAADRWSRAGLARLGEAIGPPGGQLLLVQYTPNAWGYKGLNLGFCRWLRSRGQAGDDVRVMFHELFYYTHLRDRPSRWLLPLVHRRMLRSALQGAARADYATAEWGQLLAKFPEVRKRRMTLSWLPVPSNIPVIDDVEGVAALRRRVAPDGQVIVGHFGTFSEDQRGRLGAVLPRLVLARPDRIGLLIGRNGATFAAEVSAAHPALAGRLVITGGLEASAVSRYLQVCDLLVQPYPGGICARRTSAMAGLVHGLVVVSSNGSFTEPIFEQSGCAALAPSDAPELLCRLAEDLLADPAARATIATNARATYEQHFALERTVEALLG